MGGSSAEHPVTVAIAGATSGFGQTLGRELAGDVRLVGLTRRSSDNATLPREGWEWRDCDLFSRRSTRRALEGVDHVVYLAHSARPSARLTQATPDDLDLLCADNVARAADAHDLESIVLVSTLLHAPTAPGAEAGRELIDTFGSTGVSVSTFVTDLILIPGGTTARTLRRLVERLPILACPSWVRRPIRVARSAELVTSIREYIVEGTGRSSSGIRSVGDTTTYLTLLRRTAAILGRRRWMFVLPLRMARLSAWWIALFAGLPVSLMRHFVRKVLDEDATRSLSEEGELAGALERALRPGGADDREGAMIRLEEGRAKRRALVRRSSVVRSVQRLPSPEGADARWVAREYVSWLDESLGPLLRAEIDAGPTVRFRVPLLEAPLLVLVADERACSPHSYMFRIDSGLLVSEAPDARFEFRQLPRANAVLAAVQDYRPSLPWILYRWTQAVIHGWVMARFRRHLQSADVAVDSGRLE